MIPSASVTEEGGSCQPQDRAGNSACPGTLPGARRQNILRRYALLLKKN
jgi:hypothetical protein